MKTTANILLTGRGNAAMEALCQQAGRLAGVTAVARAQAGGDPGLAAEAGFKADVLIHFLGDAPAAELHSLARPGQKDRPVTLIVYDHGAADVGLMRLAMQAGARDFITGPRAVEDSLAALRKILQEEHFGGAAAARSLVAVVNAKGGAGASTVACGLAHAFASRQGLRTLLVDLDLQFGSQGLKLDAHPEQGVREALNAIESLDEIALMGYVAKHASGLHVLGALSGELILPGEIQPARLERLFQLVQQRYEWTVVDLPRLIDPVFNLVMEKADPAIVVLQQDIASLRDAQRLIQIMTADLEIPAGRILPLVNRYQPYAPIKLEDVERTLGLRPAASVANDFKHVQAAENLGLPLAEYAPRSPATRSIRELAAALSGKQALERPGALKQFLSWLWPGV